MCIRDRVAVDPPEKTLAGHPFHLGGPNAFGGGNGVDYASCDFCKYRHIV